MIHTLLYVVTTVLQGLAILLTCFRLWHRISIRRFGREDTWAAVALLCGAACLISGSVYLSGSHETAIIAFWVYLFAFPCVVWAVRMSILYSITRLIPSSTSSSRIALGFSAFFVLLWALLVMQKAYKCSNVCWYNSPSITCQLPHSMYIYELATDVVSDMILVALPFRMLWNINLPEKIQRRLILSVFSTSIVVSFASIFRAVCRVMELHSLVQAASECEVIFCLVVCNLLVAVMYFYRILKTEGESESDEGTRTSAASVTFTTVDLENLDERSIVNDIPKGSLDITDSVSP
ncbi:hypothetical protein BV22DRAFT_160948 [Leucogyrophana mollusca]|uniref:Uncharacterized protein n=1 Tax=Leucogyrophana mollusca TaxID=85980 RepID=A0ACB8BVX6_9AGAM|nr:hypothetical protein BV22DRAFT_160948 [Leucogyrophana mollusca]